MNSYQQLNLKISQSVFIIKYFSFQIIKPYNQYDYDSEIIDQIFEYNENDDVNRPQEKDRRFEHFNSDPEPYTTTSPPVTTPYSVYKTSLAATPSQHSQYESSNNGYKRHIGQVSKLQLQTTRYSNPTTPVNQHTYYASELHQLSHHQPQNTRYVNPTTPKNHHLLSALYASEPQPSQFTNQV